MIVVSWDYAEPDPVSLMGFEGQGVEADPFEQIEARNGPVGSAEDDLDGAEEPVKPRPTGYKMESLAQGTYSVEARVYNDREKKKLCARASARVIVR